MNILNAHSGIDKCLYSLDALRGFDMLWRVGQLGHGHRVSLWSLVITLLHA